MAAYNENVDELARDWFRRCRESQMAHYEYASSLASRHVWLGVPTVLFATLAGTAIFSEWTEESTGEWPGLWRVVFGLISLASACLSALQTFLSLSDRAAKHRAAGAMYGAVRRKLEYLKKLPPATEEEVRLAMTEIMQQMDDLAATSPGIPSAFKIKIDERLKSKEHQRIFDLKTTEVKE